MAYSHWHYLLIFALLASVIWRPQFRLQLLLVGSLLFYFILEPVMFSVFLAIIALSFYFAKLLSSYSTIERKKWLKIYFGLLALLYFPLKYSFAISKTLSLSGDFSHFYAPIGLSFFTFQAISYVIDVYYEKIKPEDQFSHFVLYISFFPQLVCGPIERAQNFIPQLKNPAPLTSDQFFYSVALICSGMIKKLLISDGLVSVYLAYEKPLLINGWEWVWVSVISRLSLFFDIAGYSDIAVATAALFGITITKNFNRPFSAESITEFWRRWHVTVSSWIKDYVFIPIVSRIRGPFAIPFGVICSFLFLGAWHGASINYLFYGLLNGLAVLFDIGFINKLTIRNNQIFKKIYWILTLIFFVFLPTLFLYSDSFGVALTAYGKIFHFSSWSLSPSDPFVFILEKGSNSLKMIAAYLLLILFKIDPIKYFCRLPRPIQIVCWSLLIAIITYSKVQGRITFVYEGI